MKEFIFYTKDGKRIPLDSKSILKIQEYQELDCSLENIEKPVQGPIFNTDFISQNLELILTDEEQVLDEPVSNIKRRKKL